MSTKIIVALATIWLILSTLVFGLVTSPAFGSQNNYVERTQDFWITVPEQSLLHIWTDLCDNTNNGWCGGIVDSMLWLYDSNGNLVAQNDDSWTDHTGGYSLASTIRVSVPAGNYRVRAGVCCGDPTADRFYGNHYYMISNFEAELAPGTPSATWTPTPQPTPTPTPTPTPEPTPTPTPEPTPTPVPDPYLNAPTGLMVTVYANGNVYLTWDAPEESDTAIERYGVFWTTEGANGWGTPSSETNIGIANNVFVITGGVDRNYTFWIRADNDTLQIYSAPSTSISVFVPLIVPEPTPTPTPEPTPTPTEEPTNEPTPTPTPEPTPTPTAEPTPTPHPTPTSEPSPSPTPTRTPQPTPSPSPTPEPSLEPSPTPSSEPSGDIPPSPEPSPEPTEPPFIDPGAAVDSAVEAISEAAATVGEAIDNVSTAAAEAVAAVFDAAGAAVDTVSNLGKDISEEEKAQDRPVIVAAVIVSQIAGAAARSAMSAQSNSGGGFSGGGDKPSGSKRGPRNSKSESTGNSEPKKTGRKGRKV